MTLDAGGVLRWARESISAVTVWEFERIDWAAFEVCPGTDVNSVPGALAALLTAADADQALKAYWKLDNVVVVQGRAYSAALPTAQCAVQILASGPRPEARVRVVELSEQLSGAGIPDGDEALLRDINRAIRRGFPCYAVLLQIGSELERELCTDLLIDCAQGDATLSKRVQYYIRRLVEDPKASARAREYALKRAEASFSEG